jgi:hypothetical protein
MRLVDYQDRGAAPFGDFGGQRLGGLGDEGGVVETGCTAERGDTAVSRSLGVGAAM